MGRGGRRSPACPLALTCLIADSPPVRRPVSHGPVADAPVAYLKTRSRNWPCRRRIGRGPSRQGVPSNVHVASKQPRSTIRVARGALAAVVLVALGVVIAHNTVGFGSPRFSYFIEEWVYDFITLTAALATLARAALRREERLAWALLGFGL